MTVFPILGPVNNPVSSSCYELFCSASCCACCYDYRLTLAAKMNQSLICASDHKLCKNRPAEWGPYYGFGTVHQFIPVLICVRLSVSWSGKCLSVSILVSPCAVNVFGIGRAVLVSVGEQWGQLRAGRGYKIHLWSRIIKLSHASTVTESVKILLFVSFSKQSTRWSNSFRSSKFPQKSVEL